MFEEKRFSTLQNGHKKVPNCNHEVLTDEKDYFKVTAEARLKMEKDTALSMPCVAVDDSQRKPKANLIRITAEQGQAIPKNKGACGQVEHHMDPSAEKCYWSSFHYDMVH